jgi:cytoskeletal protein CcmA (bactofilin family)
MWRKQEQLKSSSEPTEPVANSATETRLPAAPAPAPPRAVLPGSRLIGDLTIKGEITGNEDLFIDARVEGLVHLAGGTAVVGPNGRVTANIDATRIVIEGDLNGSLDAAESVSISASGKTWGKIGCRRISVEDGAEIHGDLEVMRDMAAPAQSIPNMAEAAVPRAAQAVAPLAREVSAA